MKASSFGRLDFSVLRTGLLFLIALLIPAKEITQFCFLKVILVRSSLVAFNVMRSDV